jgi:NAD(P)-dependent dehydrogenase (short-subunit alcohol dehydrogenase family)
MTMTLAVPHAAVARGQRLDGKVALVTGAGGQLGRRVALALGDRGASIVLNDRGNHQAAVAETIGQLDGAGASGTAVPAGLSSSTEVASLFDQAQACSGRLDVVVHTPGRVTKAPLAEIGDEEFEASIDANVRVAFHVLREAARRVADHGRIITISTSITGVTIPGYSIYAGHKAATEHYVRGLAKELGPRGITVNAVAPGPVNSPFYFGAETEQSFQAATHLSGAGRLGEWDEIVPLIAFLCTPDAQWITAQTIRVNGGMTA